MLQGDHGPNFITEEVPPLGRETEPAWRTHMAPDAFYQELDLGIRFAVRVLHAHGVETQQSCEGGDGHAYDRPTIDLPASDHGHTGLAALYYLHQYGLDVQDVAMLWRVHRGLPVEHFWRITFWKATSERADEHLMFVYGCRAVD